MLFQARSCLASQAAMVPRGRQPAPSSCPASARVPREECLVFKPRDLALLTILLRLLLVIRSCGLQSTSPERYVYSSSRLTAEKA